MTGSTGTSEEPIDSVREVPTRSVATYARLWQLETWLRQMVYIELCAAFGRHWTQEVAGQPRGSLTADLRLTHMPTPDASPISYVTFGSLCRTIGNHWDLFSVYLPPRDLWEAKLSEVAQIRNRVAHFRLGHFDDLTRLLQFMRDLDDGFWRFCTSYNDAYPVLPPSKDPVTKRFQHLDQFPYVRVNSQSWAKVGVADPDAMFSMSIGVLQRPWQTSKQSGRSSGQPGLLYDVTIVGRDNHRFNYARLLEDTKRLHGDVVHICIDSFGSSVRFTIPAILGARVVNHTIQAFVDRIPNSLHRSHGSDQTDAVERLAGEWPEYVLGPEDPLVFLEPQMVGSFFSA
ncbi:hypothetical protein [Nocardioides ganghwensis]|uniref:Uncharacterized protein n=1 Tax=Nocardioides ganghwensis TaxID=252230 RepID=A0A4Q2SA11_9ACTN|nr:hypothetical protein [Nocardioides ganghwensis]MBD3945654.1 hypothetical protein [Nocardioides ganghwensis]RYC01065.1 hypothetical protein EUA07_11760 [Nocardioides ganghwensis]